MATANTPGISALAHEVALGLARLLGQHVKIAQLELTHELHTMGRRATLIAVLVTIVALGYGMAMVALALLIAGQAGVGLPLLVVGLAHMVGGGVGLVLLPLSPHGSRLMDNSRVAMNRSLAVLDEVGSASGPPIVEKPRGH